MVVIYLYTGKVRGLIPHLRLVMGGEKLVGSDGEADTTGKGEGRPDPERAGQKSVLCH